MPAWVIWLLIAAVLGVAEVFSMTLVLGILAVAALVAALAGAIGLPVAIQIIAFAAAAVAGLLVVRPIIRRHTAQAPALQSGTARLVGKSGVVVHEVTGESGIIKLVGEEWSARSIDEDLVIPAGTHVDVLEIDGATAVVYPREALP